MKNPNITLLPDPKYQKTGWPWAFDLSEMTESPQEDIQLPKISIVTPSFNQGRFLEETIRSVLMQNYTNLEYMIIDGGSTDGSVEIIKEYEPWLAYWQSQPDQGQSDAINQALNRATGDWFSWINADDYYLPGVFHKIANISLCDPDLNWIVGKTLFVDSKLEKLATFNPRLSDGKWRNHRGAEWVDYICTKKSQTALPQPASFWKREIVKSVGGIDLSLNYVMDHELYIRLAYQECRPYLLEDILASFRFHQEQKSADFPVEFWREELEIVNKWLNQVEGVEKEILKNYGKWFERRIRFQPFLAVFQAAVSRVKGIIHPTYNKINDAEQF